MNFIECQVAVNTAKTRSEFYSLLVHLHLYFHCQIMTTLSLCCITLEFYTVTVFAVVIRQNSFTCSV